MNPVLLIDFGSTYTKVVAVDVSAPCILGCASAHTTIWTDVGEGLDAALGELYKQTGHMEFAERYACSSAAGGLRMIASGLVPELTAQAAHLAVLGAGAKVIKTYAFQLTDDDIAEIDGLVPDIFLLTGGTDGGNSECILHNAQALSTCKSEFPIVIAGNRTASPRCAEILAGREVYRCENVLPGLDRLNIDPVGAQIREVFLSRIVHAKGLSRAAGLISGIVMPTPSAMLSAMKLLSDGYGGECGMGELIGVDLGGATTDVYSIADGLPDSPNTVLKGIPEPRVKRTVEGDIGMRYSISGVLDAVGIESVAALSGLSAVQVQSLVEELTADAGRLPVTPEVRALDFALASSAVKTAVSRHAGMLERVFTPLGEAYAQMGKDLRRVRQIIVTGGSLIHDDRAAKIASHAFYDRNDPFSLRPENPEVLIDYKYILPAMGLLGEIYPAQALILMKNNLKGAA